MYIYLRKVGFTCILKQLGLYIINFTCTGELNIYVLQICLWNEKAVYSVNSSLIASFETITIGQIKRFLGWKEKLSYSIGLRKINSTISVLKNHHFSFLLFTLFLDIYRILGLRKL